MKLTGKSGKYFCAVVTQNREKLKEEDRYELKKFSLPRLYQKF